MAERSLRELLRFVHRMAGPPQGVLSDAELLGRFVDFRDEAAFEALVWRHGSLVLGVCRRVLRHEQDAEDAFQAAFLALARKAASVRRRGSIGPWLYRVALRVALRARSQSVGPKSPEPLPDALAVSTRCPDAERRELQRILEEEIQSLPRRYRATVVLRYLEGRSTAEAALALACPAGTVQSRLAWARRRLQARLAARGATLPAVLAAAVAANESRGALPFQMVAACVRGALAFATPGKSGLNPTRSALLAEGVLRAMMLTKMKVAALLILGLLTSGTILQAPLLWAGRPEAQRDAPPAEPTASEQTPAEGREVRVLRPIKGEIPDLRYYNCQAQASSAILIRPQVTATLDKILVKPGTTVKRGDVLFELDARVLRLKELKAESQARQADTARSKAARAMEQAKALQKKSLMSPLDVENASGALADATAALEVARAEREQATFELRASQVTAPIPGRVGEIYLPVGSLASPSNEMTRLTTTDPLKVEFRMSEADFRVLRKQLSIAGAAEKLPVFLSVAADVGFPRRGHIESIGNQFEANTISVKAVFPNPQEEIMPGMNIKVLLPLGTTHPGLLVPEEALANINGRIVVNIVNTKNIVERRDVTAGELQQGLQEIHSGINADDLVIISKIATIEPGELVKPREIKPPAKGPNGK